MGRFLTANGLNFCIDVVGEGEKVLFLGGTGWDLRILPNPTQSPMAQAFRVALYDQRGMGRSDKPDGPYSMHDFAQDAVGVLDALEWSKVNVVGYSFGGMVAQELAINWPERINKLVLAATSPGGAGGSSYPIHEFLELSPYERARKGLEIADKSFTKRFQQENPAEARAVIQSRQSKQTRFAHEENAFEGLKSQLLARAEHDCFNRLHKIKAQTLVLAGDNDGQAPIDTVRNLSKAIEHSEMRVLPGTHNFLFENDYAYQHMVSFLK